MSICFVSDSTLHSLFFYDLSLPCHRWQLSTIHRCHRPYGFPIKYTLFFSSILLQHFHINGAIRIWVFLFNPHTVERVRRWVREKICVIFSSAKIGSFRNRCRWSWTREQRWSVAMTHNILVFVPPSATPTEVRWEREKSYRRERCATIRRRGGWWWWRWRGGGERTNHSCLSENDRRS